MFKSIEQKARRAARRVGLVARKSPLTGGFMIVDPLTDIPVAGFEYDLSADGVLNYCEDN
jgi:hypothetical protein